MNMELNDNITGAIDEVQTTTKCSFKVVLAQGNGKSNLRNYGERETASTA